MPKVPYSVNAKARVLPRYTFSSCINAVTRSTKRVATSSSAANTSSMSAGDGPWSSPFITSATSGTPSTW